MQLTLHFNGCAVVAQPCQKCRILPRPMTVTSVPSNSSMTSLYPGMLFATFTLHLAAGLSTTRYTHTQKVREKEDRVCRFTANRTRVCTQLHPSTRGSQLFALCGWNCRTAVHPVGCVGCVRRPRLRWYLVNFRPASRPILSRPRGRGFTREGSSGGFSLKFSSAESI